MKYNKGFAPLILVAIIVGALVIGGGIYFAQEKKNNSDFINYMKELKKAEEREKKAKENQNVENQITDNSEDIEKVSENSKSEESPVTKNDVTNQPAYLKSVYAKDGKNYIDVDYVQWIVCSADTKTGGCMNGYDIVNDNPLIRTFLISDNVIIKMQTFSHQTSGLDKGNYNWNEIVSLEKFKGIINGTTIPPDYEGSLPYKSWFKDLPYSITVKNGVITEITERYIP